MGKKLNTSEAILGTTEKKKAGRKPGPLEMAFDCHAAAQCDDYQG